MLGEPEGEAVALAVLDQDAVVLCDLVVLAAGERVAEVDADTDAVGVTEHPLW